MNQPKKADGELWSSAEIVPLWKAVWLAMDYEPVGGANEYSDEINRMYRCNLDIAVSWLENLIAVNNKPSSSKKHWEILISDFGYVATGKGWSLPKWFPLLRLERKIKNSGVSVRERRDSLRVYMESFFYRMIDEDGVSPDAKRLWDKIEEKGALGCVNLVSRDSIHWFDSEGKKHICNRKNFAERHKKFISREGS